MTMRHSPGFHEGELAVQERAGVAAQAARLTGMLATPDLRGGFARFLAARTFVAMAGVDAEDHLWASPVIGAAGFLHVAGPTHLVVGATPVAGDPLHDMPSGRQVGLIAIDFASRRRVRINGTLTSHDERALAVDVAEAFGNCPQYIHPRELTAETPTGNAERRDHMDAADVTLVTAADTFFIASTHPRRGVDISHRGGDAGFVRTENGELWWPDYSGNNMFTTLGNLAVDPTAALLFADFTTGRTVQLSGRAHLEWVEPGSAIDDDTGRRVRFTPEAVVSGTLLPVRATT